MNREARRQAEKVRDTKRIVRVRREPGFPADPISIAIGRATLLTKPEIMEIVGPARGAVDAMRQGIGTLHDWQVLASAVNISKAIERQGIVRGLSGHLAAAESALATIHRRAVEELRTDPSARYAYALHLDEIEVLALAIELLFDYQLRHLSRGELRKATVYAENEVRSSGGQVIDNRPAQVQSALPLTP